MVKNNKLMLKALLALGVVSSVGLHAGEAGRFETGFEHMSNQGLAQLKEKCSNGQLPEHICNQFNPPCTQPCESGQECNILGARCIDKCCFSGNTGGDTGGDTGGGIEVGVL